MRRSVELTQSTANPPRQELTRLVLKRETFEQAGDL